MSTNSAHAPESPQKDEKEDKKGRANLSLFRGRQPLLRVSIETVLEKLDDFLIRLRITKTKCLTQRKDCLSMMRNVRLFNKSVINATNVTS